LLVRYGPYYLALTGPERARADHQKATVSAHFLSSRYLLGHAGHFYAAVFMRAMLGYAPLMDTREYAIYAVAFFSMSLLTSSPPVDQAKEAQD